MNINTEIVDPIVNAEMKTTKIEEYITSMTEKEKKAYEIAKNHLNMSFDLEKSNGYKEWLLKK